MRSLTQAIACAGLILAASHASAAVIDLEPTGSQYFGPTYTQNGYDFQALTVPGEVASAVFFNEKYYEANGWDADAPGSAPGENYTNVPVVVSKTDGSAFDFFGIKLAGIYNDGSSSGPVDFTFTHANGATDAKSVSITPGVIGFQSFGFSETDLTSFTFTPSTTAYALQFDYVNVADSVSAVPLPAGLPMFGGALLALGGLGFGLRRRQDRSSATPA